MDIERIAKFPPLFRSDNNNKTSGPILFPLDKITLIVSFLTSLGLVLNLFLQIYLVIISRQRNEDYLIFSEFYIHLCIMFLDFTLLIRDQNFKNLKVNSIHYFQILFFLSSLAVFTLNIYHSIVNDWGLVLMNYILVSSAVLSISGIFCLNFSLGLHVTQELSHLEIKSAQVIWNQDTKHIALSDDFKLEENLDSIKSAMTLIESSRSALTIRLLCTMILLIYDFIISIIIFKDSVVESYSLSNLIWCALHFLLNSYVISNINTKIKRVFSHLHLSHHGFLIVLFGIELNHLMILSLFTSSGTIVFKLIVGGSP
jgi:hypothetical protein